jgi:DNA-binding MarR family transcriptional regulator
MRSEAGAESLPRLGYLLKQAHLQFMERAAEALAPLGIGSREWAALICLDDERGLSQGEVAQQLGIDRTTMVALVDTLQRKGLVARLPHPGDRRKNRIALTPEGRSVMEAGARLADEVERQFLAGLSPPDVQQLKGALHTVITPVSSPG